VVRLDISKPARTRATGENAVRTLTMREKRKGNRVVRGHKRAHGAWAAGNKGWKVRSGPGAADRVMRGKGGQRLTRFLIARALRERQKRRGRWICTSGKPFHPINLESADGKKERVGSTMKNRKKERLRDGRGRSGKQRGAGKKGNATKEGAKRLFREKEGSKPLERRGSEVVARRGHKVKRNRYETKKGWVKRGGSKCWERESRRFFFKCLEGKMGKKKVNPQQARTGKPARRVRRIEKKAHTLTKSD